MSGNREKRISFRVDPKTGEALERFTERTRRKVTDVVHEALHKFLIANDPHYRAEILGEEEPTRVAYGTTPSSAFPLVAEPGPGETPFSPGDAPPASPGDFSRTASS